MGKKSETVNIDPHPDNVLIRISKAAWDELFYKRIIRDDGSEIDLLTRIEEKEGFDNRFTQNVSVGHIVAVGRNVKNVYLSDIAILDYLVSNNNDCTVGFFKEDKLVSIKAKTTYHLKPSKRNMLNRRAFMAGDFDTLSPLLGVVRKKQMVAFAPYVFVEHKSNLIVKVNAAGRMYNEYEAVPTRTVIAADPEFGYKDGDEVVMKEDDLFFRQVEGKEISLVIDREILARKRYTENISASE